MVRGEDFSIQPSPPTVESTIALIAACFGDKLDKQGVPAYLHSVAVMERLGAKAPLHAKLAALLHDVLEDTKLTEADLRKLGYGDDVLRTLLIVGKAPTAAARELKGDEKNDYYLMKIMDIARSGDEWAIRIKIEDLEENTRPDRFDTLTPDEQEKRTNKYLGMKAYLRASLERLTNAQTRLQ